MNTSRNEQENSVLARVRSYVSYMTQHNFMFTVRFFFALRNILDIAKDPDELGLYRSEEW
jgi:hypothetical protein